MTLSLKTILPWLALAALTSVVARAQAWYPAPAVSDSASAEGGFLRRIESFQNVNHEALFVKRDSVLRADFAAMQWEALRLSGPTDSTLRGAAYRNLFDLARTDSVGAMERLLEVVRGLATYAHLDPTLAYGKGPILLAERTGNYAEADALVRGGLDSVLVQLERDRVWFEDEEEFESVRDQQMSVLNDALGWIHHLAGRSSDAEKALLEAHALWATNVENLYHLGRFYEQSAAGGDADLLARAEHYFRMGSVAPTPVENPNRPALKALYARTRGGLDGWDVYEEAFEAADREQRRTLVLAERRSQPEILPPFTLERMQGGRLSSADLQGRMFVVNFWGVWCTWCVREMPEFQQLHERYADSSDVAIISINNDADWQEAVAWMSDQGFDFTALRDDGYVSQRARVHGFPTTWFIDHTGRIVFQKRGWTERLLEEFTWRIEAIRRTALD